VYWCAGNLSVDIATAKFSCDGTALGNEAQTDSMSIDIAIRAVASQYQSKFSCTKPYIPPSNNCEIEGYKYDQDGKPLSGWDIGLEKFITHNKGVDTYDLATDVTDEDGYYCLKWDGESRTPRGTPTYKNGPYTFVYHVYEKLKPDWKNVSIEKGPNYYGLAVVPAQDIKKDGQYVSVSLGSGYIINDAAYRVDFYNQKVQSQVHGDTHANKVSWHKVEKKGIFDKFKKVFKGNKS
jgi:hypothetical protein